MRPIDIHNTLNHTMWLENFTITGIVVVKYISDDNTYIARKTQTEKTIKPSSHLFISKNTIHYACGNVTGCFSFYDCIRPATPEEERWFEDCEVAGKLVDYPNKEKSTFPENWVIQGDRQPHPSPMPDNYWFQGIGKYNIKPSFGSNYYYTRSNIYEQYPSEYILVTKEELLNHYKPKIQENEQIRETPSNGEKRKGLAISSRSRQTSITDRLIGNPQSARVKHAKVRSCQIGGSVVTL